MTVLGDPPSTHIKDVAFSPDGKTFSGVTNSGGVRVWNYSDGSLLYTLKYPSFGSISSYPSVEGFVFAVAYSPDSKTLATGGLDHLIRFWRLSDGQALTTSDHQVGIEALAFSPNGELLASAGHEGPIRIWRTSDGSLLETLEGHLDTVYQLSWSPDGKMLASGGADKTVRLWDIKTGQQILFLKGHAKTVTSVAFSPDGKTLASGSSDHTVCLWQLKP